MSLAGPTPPVPQGRTHLAAGARVSAPPSAKNQRERTSQGSPPAVPGCDPWPTRPGASPESARSLPCAAAASERYPPGTRRHARPRSTVPAAPRRLQRPQPMSRRDDREAVVDDPADHRRGHQAIAQVHAAAGVEDSGAGVEVPRSRHGRGLSRCSSTCEAGGGPFKKRRTGSRSTSVTT